MAKNRANNPNKSAKRFSECLRTGRFVSKEKLNSEAFAAMRDSIIKNPYNGDRKARRAVQLERVRNINKARKNNFRSKP